MMKSFITLIFIIFGLNAFSQTAPPLKASRRHNSEEQLKPVSLKGTAVLLDSGFVLRTARILSSYYWA